MNYEEFLIFLAIYTPAAIAVGWCLCLALHKPMPEIPKKCNDSIFER